MSIVLGVAVFTFLGLLIGLPILLKFAQLFGLYAIVEERTCRVYTLFGRVVATIDEPGLHILPAEIGLSVL
jgi:hypothetical protein